MSTLFPGQSLQPGQTLQSDDQLGMNSSQCWALVSEQRRNLANGVTDLPEIAWDTASLCAGWRVRDVVAHVVGNAEGAFTPRRALPGLVAHRFNIDAFLYDDARRRGAASPAELATRLRGSADGAFLPPGRRPVDVLGDVIIHSQDVFMPVGIDRHARPVAVLAVLSGVPRGVRADRRAAGLRLRAADLDWAWGQGEDVTGTGEALLMALAGRSAFAARLSGPGAATLAARCQTSAPADNQATH